MAVAEKNNVIVAPEGKIKKRKKVKPSDTPASIAEEQGTAPVAVKKEKKKKKTTQPAADQQAVVTLVQTANGATPKKQSKKRKLQDKPAERIEGATEATGQPASEGPMEKKTKKAKKADAAATEEQSVPACNSAAIPVPAGAAAAMPAGTVSPPKNRKQAGVDAKRKARKLKKQEKKEKEAAEAAESAATRAAQEATKEKKGDKFKRLKKEREEKRRLKALLTAQADGGVLPADNDGGKKTKKKKKKKKQEVAAATGAAEQEQGATPSKATQEQSFGQTVNPSALVKEPAPVHETLPPPSAATVAEASPSTAAENGGSSQKNSNGKGEGRAFQRVKADEWLNQKGAWNNSYEANFGNSGWGAGAQAVLGKVRGKDFRHEKTKKKRGSYRGGAIDHSVNSFKFESDGE